MTFLAIEVEFLVGVPAREFGWLRVPCLDPGLGGVDPGLVMIFNVGRARPFDCGLTSSRLTGMPKVIK